MLGPILHTLSHALTDRVRRTFRRATRSESRLRVGVDIRPFYEPLTGIGWYLYHLLHEIAKREDIELFLFGDARVTDIGPIAPVVFIPGKRDTEAVEPGPLSVLQPATNTKKTKRTPQLSAGLVAHA